MEPLEVLLPNRATKDFDRGSDCLFWINSLQIEENLIYFADKGDQPCHAKPSLLLLHPQSLESAASRWYQLTHSRAVAGLVQALVAPALASVHLALASPALRRCVVASR